MPRLWEATIDGHRRAVRDATLDAAATLVAERGVRAVTMSEIAERVGIGRATLYKYFPDVDAILASWHERQVDGHLDHLAAVRDETEGPAERLRAVVEALGLIQWQRIRHHTPEFGDELVDLLHRDDRLDRAHGRLHEMIRDLVAEAADAGHVRNDVDADELAVFCVHALGGARALSSHDAVLRLVSVVLEGLRGADA